jgi:hypothetical protein
MPSVVAMTPTPDSPLFELRLSSRQRPNRLPRVYRHRLLDEGTDVLGGTSDESQETLDRYKPGKDYLAP